MEEGGLFNYSDLSFVQNYEHIQLVTLSLSHSLSLSLADAGQASGEQFRKGLYSHMCWDSVVGWDAAVRAGEDERQGVTRVEAAGLYISPLSLFAKDGREYTQTFLTHKLCPAISQASVPLVNYLTKSVLLPPRS